jgi:hypothetical protein
MQKDWTDIFPPCFHFTHTIHRKHIVYVLNIIRFFNGVVTFLTLGLTTLFYIIFKNDSEKVEHFSQYNYTLKTLASG